ncbi:MAG TPA: type 4a pilus biogenesis protein PilO [Candidatus Limnocylindria bacterium]|nr:type 4a pilus biogenesis protein PilO [Candidatus Limnocylindria bacterium]
MIERLSELMGSGSSKQQLAMGIGAVLLILFLDWQYVYGPKAAALSLARSEVETLHHEYSAKRAKANAREEFEKELKQLAASVKEAEARLPDEREIADLLSSVASSARAVGLDITLFRQKTETYSDFYANVPVEMTMRGTYHELAQFLDRVRQLDRIVNVGEIGIKNPRVMDDTVLLDASCTATTFRFLSEAERKRIQAEKSKGGKGGQKVRTGA